MPKLSDSLIKEKIKEEAEAESGAPKKEKRSMYQRVVGSRSAGSVQQQEELL